MPDSGTEQVAKPKDKPDPNLTLLAKLNFRHKWVAFVAIATLISISQQRSYTSLYSHVYSQRRASAGNDVTTTAGSNVNASHWDEAETIIRRAYERSYAHILPCDSPHDQGKKCMQKTIHHFRAQQTLAKEGYKSEDEIPQLPLIPWWFQTLLRDIEINGAFGSWHHFSTTDPPLRLCTIAKIGTTEWRRVFCNLNSNETKVLCNGGKCKKRCKWATGLEMPSDAPRAVFLRDPLERLLSGYLDKCLKDNVRQKERHCEPNIVFNPEPDQMNYKNKKMPILTEDLKEREKMMFAAYVDVLPLKWNLHFIPQSIACDLHRHIDQYDFIGYMGKDFMKDLDRMANQFGGRLPDALNEIFEYKKYLNDHHENTGATNRHATKAVEKVTRFYSAQTVRRALEYLSIDYVTLGLKVPDWAREMLREDLS